MILGVDPGREGALALIGETVKTVPLKILDGRLDLHWLAAWLRFHPEIKMVGLEEVHAVFGSSAGATFSFGWGLGAIQGVLSTLHLPYRLIPPKVWQKTLGITHEPKTPPKLRKEKNLAVCKKLFPAVNLLATERSKVPHMGIVDALLISEYTRRIS